jgi:hypothetical protein
LVFKISIQTISTQVKLAKLKENEAKLRFCWELYAECGYDAQGIFNCAVELIAEKRNVMVS